MIIMSRLKHNEIVFRYRILKAIANNKLPKTVILRRANMMWEPLSIHIEYLLKSNLIRKVIVSRSLTDSKCENLYEVTGIGLEVLQHVSVLTEDDQL